MCHNLLQDNQFFHLLHRIDIDLAAQTRAGKCSCGGVLHQANYVRKPRGCPRAVRTAYSLRFSCCCNRCRKRTTAMSVRFLGRRVYLALAVVLMSARRAGPTFSQRKSLQALAIPLRTLTRWRTWWAVTFPATSFWRGNGARFMPPVTTPLLPLSLLERFTGHAAHAMTRLLAFLRPLSLFR